MYQKKKYSISFIMPAFNEEDNLMPSVEALLSAVRDRIDYELIIFDDGSTDSTGDLVDRLSLGNSHIRVVHNKTNMNLGYIIKEGLSRATKDYFVIAPAHNRLDPRSYDNIINSLNGGDVIVGYITNLNLYPWKRRVISFGNTMLINFLFNLRIKYYHFPILRVDAANRIKVSTDSYAAMPEIMVRLLRSGASYSEVPIYIKARSFGRSRALRPKNILGILRALAGLYKEIIIGI